MAGDMDLALLRQLVGGVVATLPDNCASLEDLRPWRPEPKLPRPHNTEAIEAVCAGFSTGNHRY
jgi:hypothetical protein